MLALAVHRLDGHPRVDCVSTDRRIRIGALALGSMLAPRGCEMLQATHRPPVAGHTMTERWSGSEGGPSCGGSLGLGIGGGGGGGSSPSTRITPPKTESAQSGFGTELGGIWEARLPARTSCVAMLAVRSPSRRST